MIEELPIYNKILVILIDLIGILLAILVYRNNPKGLVNRIFLIMVVLMFSWVNFAYFARLVAQSQVGLSLLYLKIAWLATPLLFVFLYFLVIYLLQKEKEYRVLNKIIIITGGIIAFVTGFTSLVVEGIKFTNGDLAIVYGKGMIPFLGVVFLFMCATLYILLKEYLRFSPREKRKIEYLLIGIFIFYFANIIFNIFFPLILNIVRFYWVGDYSAIFLLGFTSYAIVKRELFGVKVVLTTLFVGMIAILLTLDTFVFTKGFALQIVKGVILAIFLAFGYSLIQSVLREVKYREQLQVAYQKLRELDKAKSEFVSIASHQLRTPLTAIKGYISMVLEGSYGKLPERAKSPVENVFKSSQRLIKLVNDLLSVSKIEAGKMELDIQRSSLADIISSVIEELKIEIKKKNIYLKWGKPKKPLPDIFIDRDKIRQVILNIIDNAIRYTNKGGVTIKSEVVNSDIRIRISDTGAGLSREELSKMFGSFSRGTAGSQFYTEGVGLGLYVSKKFVEMHKGEIWAESKGKGKGSVFFIKLPIAQELLLDEVLRKI